MYTDNNPLSYLQTFKLGAVEQRWASQLAFFDFELKYRPGAMNKKADALSRLPGQSLWLILPQVSRYLWPFRQPTLALLLHTLSAVVP